MISKQNSLKKRACIITVYNSENCGSFWQARALKEYLEEMGYEVLFLKRNMKGSSHSPSFLMKKIAYSIIQRHPEDVVPAIAQFRQFSKASTVFTETTSCDSSFDICILGSDTIWNLKDEYFVKERNVYWGACSGSRKVISYAASLGNADENEVKRFPELSKFLRRLDGISVRDNHTFDIIKKITEKNVELVCDPTLLYSKSFYSRFAGAPKDGKYIFVYYFGTMPKDLESAIVDHAEKNKLKIIVMGKSMRQCTCRDCFDPIVFLNRFLYADLVVSNTFHGTLFSVIFEKNAIFNSKGKKKIRDFVDRLGIGEHDYAVCTDVEGLFTNSIIDYGMVRQKTEEFKKESKRYLDSYVR